VPLRKFGKQWTRPRGKEFTGSVSLEYKFTGEQINNYNDCRGRRGSHYKIEFTE